ncbi:MAG: hypothetical protein RL463_994 [Bacteroidota bacterium]|jgi:hypothetical protein
MQTDWLDEGKTVAVVYDETMAVLFINGVYKLKFEGECAYMEASRHGLDYLIEKVYGINK